MNLDRIQTKAEQKVAAARYAAKMRMCMLNRFVR
jgi:hypothetical protein